MIKKQIKLHLPQLNFVRMNDRNVSKSLIYKLFNNLTDCRFIIFVVLICYFGLLILSEIKFGSYSLVGYYFQISPLPYFSDLKILICGIEAIRDNSNPYKLNCDTLAIFNYPYTWGIFSILSFVNESNLIYIGIGLAISIFTALYFFIGKCNLWEAIIYSLLFISPAIMLGVERGNCDLIIFLIILLGATYKKSKITLGASIFFAAILKLYPIAALLCIFNINQKNIKNSILLFGIFFSGFIIYLFAFKENIVQVSNTTPRPFYVLAYGLGVLPSLYISQNNFFLPKTVFITFGIFLLVGFCMFYYFQSKYFKIPQVANNHQGNLYVIGASIFVITCLIGYNWEYRLIFLLFTIPQILIWLKNKNTVVFVVLLLNFAILWKTYVIFLSGLFHFYFYYQYIAQGFVILLFYFHLSNLLTFIELKLAPQLQIKKLIRQYVTIK